MIQISKPRTSAYRPLDQLDLTFSKPGHLRVFDGQGRVYHDAEVTTSAKVQLAGALGTHLLLLTQPGGEIAGSIAVPVDCQTEINDSGNRWGNFLEKLRVTMGTAELSLINGKLYNFYVNWIRDHTHTLKGMRYFDRDMRTGFELYADTQRADGLIWDRVEKYGRFPVWREHTFAKGGFAMRDQSGLRLFERIPVENDLEFLFIECLYMAWKATGDTEWMRTYLDHALKAVHYATTDRYRWSTKFNLLKRSYTIDTWDYVSEYDLLGPVGMDNIVDPDRSQMGIFHGDNTGMANSCSMLAEMLTAAGRDTEAAPISELGSAIQSRLDALSWNGQFYRHWVGENPKFRRDFGIDEETIVSLSCAYAVNRQLTHEQIVAIIKTYQRIRGEMPESSPGEFYNCYPPFEKGFREKWGYMNGGVSTICAGELARGAFLHGYENYASGILDRVEKVSSELCDDRVDVCLRGCLSPDEPVRSFETLDLRSVANVDFSDGCAGVPGWIGEPGNDIGHMPVGPQTYTGVPFDVIVPAENGLRGCLGISARPMYRKEASIEVGKKAKSIYFLHTMAKVTHVSGWFVVHYEDGSHALEYLQDKHNIRTWFLPGDVDSVRRRKDHAEPWKKGFPNMMVGWRGPNAQFKDVAVFNYGWNNPHPEKVISRISFHAAESESIWFILALTLCDAPVWFPPTILSYGIPNGWGAAALTYALVEGLAGIRDDGPAFERAIVSPRWNSAGINEVTASVRYAGSGGYARYQYKLEGNRLRLTLSTNAEKTRVELLLPQGKRVEKVRLCGSPASAEEQIIEQSRYAVLNLEGIRVHDIELDLVG